MAGPRGARTGGAPRSANGKQQAASSTSRWWPAARRACAAPGSISPPRSSRCSAFDRARRETRHAAPRRSEPPVCGEGEVEGYRIVTDLRAEGRTRIAAYGLADVFKGMVFGPGMVCNDLPPADGKRPVQDLFVKQVCERQHDGRLARVEARHYYKAGQYAVDPNDNRVTENLSAGRAPIGASITLRACWFSRRDGSTVRCRS